MSETELTAQFIHITKKHFGPDIWIEKAHNASKRGVPDVQGVFMGMPFFFEVKAVNKSLSNTHPFSPIQIHALTELDRAGAIALGLLIRDLAPYAKWLEIQNNPFLLNTDFDFENGVRVFPIDTLKDFVEYGGGRHLNWTGMRETWHNIS